MAMGTIKIKDLLLRAHVGFSEHEKGKLQDVLINVTIHYDSTTSEKSDKPEDALNYKTITKEIIKNVEEKQFNLIEAQARMVLDIIMKYDQVKFAQVEIDKPKALRFAESVSFSLSEKR